VNRVDCECNMKDLMYSNNLIHIFPTGDNQTVSNNRECVGRYSFIQYIASAVCYKVLRGPLMTGRYLGIRTVGSQILQLCEVEVYSRGS